MESFKNYIRLITAFILSATAVMAVIPEGSLKNCVKFVISAILMCIVLLPVSKLKDFDINLYASEYTINNGTTEYYEEYTIGKVKTAVQRAVADFAEKKNITIQDTEVICKNNKIEKIVTDKNLVAYIDEISDILGVPREYIQTAE